jgi:hypothetical protein
VDYEIVDRKIADKWIHTSIPFIVPVDFNILGRQMLRQSVRVLNKNMIRISPDFDKLVTYLRTAVTKSGTDDLNKDEMSYNNVGDCYRMLSMVLKDNAE